MTWRVNEDQQVELQARAEDSIDDLSGLRYEWSLGLKPMGVLPQYQQNGLLRA